MSKTKLKTAILGISDHNMLIFEAVAKADFLKIEAVADTNSELAQETAAFLNCTWYDDYRSLIVQNQFDCIIVAAPWHSCSKYVKDAIRKRSNVIAVTVPGRDFEEAVELVQLAKDCH
jgi:predicted dehydrogenase